MAKLRLGPISDEKPVRITTELPAAVHRDLLAYTDALARETGQAVEPTKLVGPMLARFMAMDRGFAKFRRNSLAGTRVDASISSAPAAEPPTAPGLKSA